MWDVDLEAVGVLVKLKHWKSLQINFKVSELNGQIVLLMLNTGYWNTSIGFENLQIKNDTSPDRPHPSILVQSLKPSHPPVFYLIQQSLHITSSLIAYVSICNRLWNVKTFNLKQIDSLWH